MLCFYVVILYLFDYKAVEYIDDCDGGYFFFKKYLSTDDFSLFIMVNPQYDVKELRL